MVGHNANEGLLFTNSAVTNGLTSKRFSILKFMMAHMDTRMKLGGSTLSSRSQHLGKQPSRRGLLSLLYNNDTYAYQFSVPPALHWQDVTHTLFNGPNAQVQGDLTAIALQAYITSFAETSVPSDPKLPFVLPYGNSSEMQELDATNIAEIMDPTVNARCL
ncbi:hypothetical protein G7Y79_00016g041550 [Physcia stellaris]|nr:hypothetical protein G7Y79_00016g041550 [Physcia stellaris]